MTSLFLASISLLLFAVLSVQVISGDIPPVILGADHIVAELFLNDVILAYNLRAPTVTVTTTTGSSAANKQLLFSELVDFAVDAASLSVLEQEQYPSIHLYPFLAAAIAPVYRLDAVSTPIVLSRNVLASIFTGNITWWNDTALAIDNPNTVMPNIPITVVTHGESNALNTVFTTALCKYLSSACSTVPISPLPAWPISAYAAHASGVGTTGVASTVDTINGAIGYSILAAALVAEVSIAQMKNKAGNIVSAIWESVNFALIELATQSLQNGNTMDLTDASGASAWPLCIPVYLMIDLVNTRNTCEVRDATVTFWLYIYQSPIITQLANAREYALMPAVVLSQLNIVNDLATGVLCNNSPAFQGATTEQITVSGASSVSFIVNMLINLYGQSDSSLSYVYQDQSSQNAFDQLQDGEIDIALFFDSELDAESLSVAHPPPLSQPLSPYSITSSSPNPSEFVTIPLFQTAVTPVFNPQITPTVNIGSYNIIIDFSTYVKMYVSNISTWNDPEILQYNPSLANALGNITAPISYIVGCGNNPLVSQLYSWISTYSDVIDPNALQILYSVISNPSVLYAFANCQSTAAFSTTVLYTPREGAISDIVNSIPGAMGYTRDNSNVDNSGQFTFRFPRRENGILVPSLTTSNPYTQLACAQDTFNTDSLNLANVQSQNLSCWPFTSTVYLTVRSSYSSIANNAKNCTRGMLSLQLVQWIISNPLLTTATFSQSSPRLSEIPLIRNAISNAINSTMCDDNLLLITLPIQWSLASGINVFGISMSIIGIIAICICAAIIGYFLSHPVIKASSPPFLFTSIIGMILVLVGAILLVSTVNQSNCSALSWSLNIGFTLTFAPLFAKTWRIYRIFGRKKLSVVKISNQKLAILVTGILVVDVILLSLWQGLSPLQPITTMQITGSPPVENDYTQCNTTGAGTVFLILVVVLKGLLLLYGALLAFATRRVTDQFNESQSIAWSIYNVVFSIGIITPIILLVGANGNVLILLLLFVILWVTFFTASILIAPKFFSIFSPHTLIDDGILSGPQSVVGGFSFMAVDGIKELPQLQRYYAALQAQSEVVLKRINQMSGKTEPKISVKTIVPLLPNERHQRSSSAEISSLQQSTRSIDGINSQTPWINKSVAEQINE